MQVFLLKAMDCYSLSVEQKTDPYRIEAVDRALVLLTLLAERGRVSVTDAARELGVVPSTAHRLLSTLCHRNFAVQDDKRGYRPGANLVGPRLPAGGIPDLVRQVRPYLERLYEQVNETTHVMVLVGPDVRFVDGIEGTQPLRVGLRIGVRMPAHTTSGGKAMLADLDDGAMSRPFPGGLPQRAQQPGDDVVKHEELRSIRGSQLGFNYEESEPGVTALGASIAPAPGGIPAALTIAVPTVRAEQATLERLSEILIRVCTQARADMAGQP
jgi:IclR family transcriptional regulator, acetate operon repressor